MIIVVKYALKYLVLIFFWWGYLVLILMLWKNAFFLFLFGIQSINPERCFWKVQKDKDSSVTIIRMLCCPYLFAHLFLILTPYLFYYYNHLPLHCWLLHNHAETMWGQNWSYHFTCAIVLYTRDSRVQSMIRFYDKRLGFNDGWKHHHHHRNIFYGWENLAVTFKTVVIYFWESRPLWNWEKGSWVLTSHA